MMHVRVFESRRIAEANRAADLLRDAGIPHTRSRLVDRIEGPMPPAPADMPAVWWVVQVPQESADEARRVLAALLEETGARPRAAWVGAVYLIGLFAIVLLTTMRACGI